MLQKQNRILLLIFTGTTLALLGFNNHFVIELLILVSGFGAMAYCMYSSSKETYQSMKSEMMELEKESTAKIDEATDKLANLIAYIPSGLVYINQRGEYDVMNQKFKDILGKDVANVYSTEIDAELRQILLDAFLNEKQFIRQINIHQTDYQVLAVPMIRENRYIGCMLIFQDVTRILEGESMQKRFIADASHELKTPITAIKGMIEIINRDDFADEKTRDEFLAQIQIDTSRLEQIVEDLLLQSRLSAKEVHLEKNRFNLKQFFDGLVYEKRLELHKNEIKVIINCPSDVMIEADHFRLSQVFSNLFNNAINYAKEREIRIDCDVDSKRCKIRFCDTGRGIDPAVLPHIFDRFYRGDDGRDRNAGGSGLGLAISKSIIEAHEGTIEVESEVNKGTCFTVKLKQDN